MGNKQVVEVYADFIYYTPIGDKERIDHIRDTLTAENVEKYVEYFSFRTIIPLAVHKDILEKRRKLMIKLDPVVEEAQAYAYSNHDTRDSYMLVCLKFID